MRQLFCTLIALVALAGTSTAVFADSPHFISASASINDSGKLECTFKEAGLGNTITTADITCTAQATAVYACVNLGSKHPRAANKESASGLVSQTDTFPVRNGQTTGKIIVDPPDAPAFQPDCSPPMTVVLVSVCYNDITISGAGASVNLGSLCKTLRPDLA
jgi:hypothetical protein